MYRRTTPCCGGGPVFVMSARSKGPARAGLFWFMVSVPIPRSRSERAGARRHTATWFTTRATGGAMIDA